LPDLRERRHDHGDHADHRHPPPVHVLRRVLDPRLLRCRRPGPQRPHAPVRLAPPTLGAHMTSLWPRIEPLLAKVQKPARYIGCEDGALAPVPSPGKVAWLLVYPDAYEVGLPNQGLQILYEILNERPDALAERAYAPWTDMESTMRSAGLPLFSVDAHLAARDFDVLALNLSADPVHPNLVHLVDLAGAAVR